MRWLVFALCLHACGPTTRGPLPRPREPSAAVPPPSLSTPRLARHVAVLGEHFDDRRAFETVAVVERFFRVRGNEGYVKTLDRVERELRDGGFDAAHLRRLSLGPVRPTWTPRSARLTLLLDGAEEDLIRFDDEAGRDRAMLLVGSSAIPPTELEVIRVEQVAAGQSARGRLLLGEGGARGVLGPALAAGARGVLLRNLEPYHVPDQQPDAAQFGYLPPHEGEAVGFSLSQRVWSRLRAATERGPARVRVSVDVATGRGSAGAIEATIDGTRADGAIVYVAHVDEPGANDNASGVAALAELARAMRAGIDAGALPRPLRPIVFLWGQEMEIARTWLDAGSTDAGAGLVLDMVGEDPAIVGAPFLIERMPDPGAVWLRPPDAHTEWGASDVHEDDLTGHFLNALTSAAAAQIPAPFLWRENPFEGGSDHVPFLDRGLPAVLGWHFTDSAYHTTLDRLDRVSGPEMERVAQVFGAVGVAMASEHPDDLSDILVAVDHHAYRRMAYAGEAVTAASDPVAERRVVEAWRRWYDEAYVSIARWPARLDAEVSATIASRREAFAERFASQ